MVQECCVLLRIPNVPFQKLLFLSGLSGTRRKCWSRLVGWRSDVRQTDDRQTDGQTFGTNKRGRSLKEGGNHLFVTLSRSPGQRRGTRDGTSWQLGAQAMSSLSDKCASDRRKDVCEEAAQDQHVSFSSGMNKAASITFANRRNPTCPISSSTVLSSGSKGNSKMAKFMSANKVDACLHPVETMTLSGESWPLFVLWSSSLTASEN